jgi:DNA adenine methylase
MLPLNDLKNKRHSLEWLFKSKQMILRRLGNKKAIAKDIIKHFPPHRVYIEPFFGAGGMFFQKPKAKYNIVNDLDSDVFNLFQVVMNQKEELEKAFYMMPIHSDLLDYWKKNEEVEPVRKALRFLLISNFTLMGTGSQLSYLTNDNKLNVLEMIDATYRFMFAVTFDNSDFRKFIPKISFRGRELDKSYAFIYCDPPYLMTNDNYSNSFTENDAIDLFQTNIDTGCKFAVSEFDNPFIIELAESHNMEVIKIGERRNLKNRRTEILCVNYESPELYGLFAKQHLELAL